MTVETAFDDAAKYLPAILEKRGEDDNKVSLALQSLEDLRHNVLTLPLRAYAGLEPTARRRVHDEDDWHYIALALLLDCPVWTEDRDFFGSGVATWASDRVHLYLEHP